MLVHRPDFNFCNVGFLPVVMPGKRGSISKILASTVDTGEAERLLTTAMATSETLSGYTKDEVLYTLSYHTLPRHNNDTWSTRRVLIRWD